MRWFDGSRLFGWVPKGSIVEPWPPHEPRVVQMPLTVYRSYRNCDTTIVARRPEDLGVPCTFGETGVLLVAVVLVVALVAAKR